MVPGNMRSFQTHCLGFLVLAPFYLLHVETADIVKILL